MFRVAATWGRARSLHLTPSVMQLGLQGGGAGGRVGEQKWICRVRELGLQGGRAEREQGAGAGCGSWSWTCQVYREQEAGQGVGVRELSCRVLRRSCRVKEHEMGDGTAGQRCRLAYTLWCTPSLHPAFQQTHLLALFNGVPSSRSSPKPAPWLTQLFTLPRRTPSSHLTLWRTLFPHPAPPHIMAYPASAPCSTQHHCAAATPCPTLHHGVPCSHTLPHPTSWHTLLPHPAPPYITAYTAPTPCPRSIVGRSV